jgi:hypothetical protein
MSVRPQRTFYEMHTTAFGTLGKLMVNFSAIKIPLCPYGLSIEVSNILHENICLLGGFLSPQIILPAEEGTRYGGIYTQWIDN